MKGSFFGNKKIIFTSDKKFKKNDDLSFVSS